MEKVLVKMRFWLQFLIWVRIKLTLGSKWCQMAFWHHSWDFVHGETMSFMQDFCSIKSPGMTLNTT